MKILEMEFVYNADKCGTHTFRQIKREGKVALYERIREDNNSSFGYELFFIKTVKAGASLPDGTTVQEDYEQYPGKSVFGKTAWFLGAGPESLKWCLNRLNELVKEQSDQAIEEETEAEVEESVPVLKIEKTAPAEDIAIQIPSGKFTHAELANFNKKTRPQVYVQLQQLIRSKVLKVAGTRPPTSGKGKSSNLFEKA